MWLVENNAILTKDNLLRRHWIGDPTCYFCNENESIDHLFFLCPIARITWGIIGFCFGANSVPKNMQRYKFWIAKWLPGGNQMYTSGCAAICWAIWKCRNRACFDKKLLKHSCEIITHACSFLTNWAGLYNDVTHERILDGVQKLLACAHRVLATQQGTSPALRLLPSPPEDEQDDGGNN